MCYRQALISDHAKHEMWYIHCLHDVGTHGENITPVWPQGPTQLTFKVPMLILRNYLYIPLNDLLSRHSNKNLERLHLIKCTTEINLLFRLQEHFYYCILKVEVYVHIRRSYLRWRYYRYLRCAQYKRLQHLFNPSWRSRPVTLVKGGLGESGERTKEDEKIAGKT